MHKYVTLTSRRGVSKTNNIRGWEHRHARPTVAELMIKLLPVMPPEPVALGPEAGKQNVVVCVCCYLLHFIRYCKKKLNSGKT